MISNYLNVVSIFDLCLRISSLIDELLRYDIGNYYKDLIVFVKLYQIYCLKDYRFDRLFGKMVPVFRVKYIVNHLISFLIFLYFKQKS